MKIFLILAVIIFSPHIKVTFVFLSRLFLIQYQRCCPEINVYNLLYNPTRALFTL